MPELQALDLPAGPGFVDALRSAWQDGDAVLPVDARLPTPAVSTLLDSLRPTVVVDRNGHHRRAGGRPTEPGDALVVATSGTTGGPKGVVLTHDAVRASALATSARLGVDRATDHWVACLPLAHIGGLAVVTRSLITGTPCTVLRGFDASEVAQLAGSGATLVALVATALRRADVSGYRAVLLGGAAPPAGLPANVVTTYGQTETGSGIVYDGRPLDGVELRLGDGRGMGADGEILVRGPMLLRAYRDGSDPRLAGGWLPTGDAGRIGPDGALTVYGRMAEVIVTGGEKVWPAPVEEALAESPGVAEVAVWKRPDPEWGERVVAWVVPTDPASPPALEELRDVVATRLAPWAAPRQLVVVGALPRTANGKVAGTRSAHVTPPLAMHRAPPSITSVWPVIQEAASEHRNRAAAAMSSGPPRRPRGSRRAIASSPRSHKARAKSVLTNPGASALTRTPGPSSPASCRVRWMTAALVTLYQPMPPSTDSPPTEATLSTAPPDSDMPARQTACTHSR